MFVGTAKGRSLRALAKEKLIFRQSILKTMPQIKDCLSSHHDLLYLYFILGLEYSRDNIRTRV